MWAPTGLMQPTDPIGRSYTAVLTLVGDVQGCRSGCREGQRYVPTRVQPGCLVVPHLVYTERGSHVQEPANSASSNLRVDAPGAQQAPDVIDVARQDHVLVAHEERDMGIDDVGRRGGAAQLPRRA